MEGGIFLAVFRARKTRRGPLPFRYVLLLTFVFFIFSTAAGLVIVNKGIKPTLVRYAESQTRKIAPMVVTKAVKEVVPHVKDINEVTETISDSEGGTITQFKTDIINGTAAELATAIQANLKKAESGNLHALESESNIEFDHEKSILGEGIVYSVPLGQATNNALLGNLGPRIPVRFTAIGDVRTDIETDVNPYGINNVFIKISIQIEVNVQIIIPFATTKTTVVQDVPIAMGYFSGKVPQFYNSTGNSSPSIQLPTNP